MVLAIALVILIVGSVLFHFMSPWWLTPIASNWGMIDDTINLTFIVTGFVFVAVNAFMAYVIVRYRYRSDKRADYEPENKKLEWWLIGLTSIGVVAMLAPGLFVWAKMVTVPEDAAIVEVVGQQWHWSFRFPGEDGVLGKVNSRLVNEDNPFGMNPEDPAGRDDVLVRGNELHLPMDKPVKMVLRSKDVLHNFAVAQFRVKMDLVPGMVPYLWFTPTRTGKFDILCEELCGLGHFAMRGHVVIDEQAEYEEWLSVQPTYTDMLNQVAGDPVAGQALYGTCAACHGQDGQGNAALNAPKLSGQSGWYMTGQLQNFKAGIRGTNEKDIYGAQMASMAALLADDKAIRDVAAYIKTLPDVPAPTTLEAATGYGEKRYGTCAACHGSNGQGISAMNAPRLAGMSDWYLVTQLNNFREGVRGAHEGDKYGPQMALLASMLKDKESVNEMVAYISTLESP